MFRSYNTNNNLASWKADKLLQQECVYREQEDDGPLMTVSAILLLLNQLLNLNKSACFLLASHDFTLSPEQDNTSGMTHSGHMKKTKAWNRL